MISRLKDLIGSIADVNLGSEVDANANISHSE